MNMSDVRCDYARVNSGAIFSPCSRYRYVLYRRWLPATAPALLWVMLNPSKAGATHDDATIRKCRGFTERWGYGGFLVVNLYAWVSTAPLGMRASPDPIGPDNDRYIREVAMMASGAVLAWGGTFDHGAEAHRDALGLPGRAAAVRAILAEHLLLPTWHLGLTQSGSPRHPSRLGYSAARVAV